MTGSKARFSVREEGNEVYRDGGRRESKDQCDGVKKETRIRMSENVGEAHRLGEGGRK